jgi:hypothetical protein
VLKANSFFGRTGREKFHLWYAGRNRSGSTVNDFNNVRERKTSELELLTNE